MRYFSSIVLEAMRRMRTFLPPTLGEIEQAVGMIIAQENRPRGQHGWFLESSSDTRLDSVRQALRDVEELGLVTPVNGSDQRWRIADTWQPPAGGSGRDDGGSDGGGRSGDFSGGDGDGDSGGGGLTEVLSHPVLFALDEESFDLVVEGLFAEGQS